jgi:hypothetical protein
MNNASVILRTLREAFCGNGSVFFIKFLLWLKNDCESYSGRLVGKYSLGGGLILLKTPDEKKGRGNAASSFLRRLKPVKMQEIAQRLN